MHVKKWIKLTVCSVASLLLTCKPAMADEAANPTFWSGFNLGGYASAGATLHRNQSAEAAVNEVSLLLTWTGDSRWQFFGEFELETPVYWSKAREFTTKKSHTDLERLYLDYNFSESVNLRMGRYLTPNSRWNLLHASPLVWTSTRPLATYRLFPTATNGLMLHGSRALGEQALDYMVFAELLEDVEQDDEELRFEHVFGARVALSRQWNVGLSLLSFDEKNVQALSGDDVTYQMLGLDFITHVGDTELSGEGFARFKTNGQDGGSGAYLQAAVPLTAVGLIDWYWLTRLETLQRPNEGSDERWLVGATWRPKSTQLLKLEWVGGSGKQPEAPRGFIASFAFFF